MSRDRPVIEAISSPSDEFPSRTRSAVTNHKDLLPGLDGRSATARRFRDLVNAFVADMGGLDHCSEIKLGLDLAYGSEAWALLRLQVPRGVTETDGAGDVLLLTARLACTDLDGRAANSGPVHLRLPRVPADAFAAIVVNELVSSRATELKAAALQEQARSAAQRGDWNHVQHLLEELRAEAVSSPWLSASIAELEAYARRRETQLFSKEALYKAEAMRRRLAALDEQQGWSPDREAEKPWFVQRKLVQGRRFGGPRENPDRS